MKKDIRIKIRVIRKTIEGLQDHATKLQNSYCHSQALYQMKILRYRTRKRMNKHKNAGTHNLLK
mgnify:CR=1 FL=1